MESTRKVRAKFNARAQHMRGTAKAGATPLEQFLTEATALDVEDGPWQLSSLNSPFSMHSYVVRRFMEHPNFQNASYQWQNRFEKKVMPDENCPETPPFYGPVEVDVPEALKVHVEELLDTFRLALRNTNCPSIME